MKAKQHNLPRRIFNLVLIAALLAGIPLNALPASMVQASTLMVSNLNDAGPGSLRQAIADAADGDVVGFKDGLTGTILLTSGRIRISKNLTLNGPGASLLAVSSGYASQLFIVDPGVDLTINGLSLINGYQPNYYGGAIWNDGVLTLNDCVVSGNKADIFGGGLYNSYEGTMTLNRTTLSGNAVTGLYSMVGANGGGIWNAGVLNINDSLITANQTDLFGGGLYNEAPGAVTINNSTISNNVSVGLLTAYGGGGGIYSLSGVVQLNHSQVTKNRASAILAYGGGIATYWASDMTLDHTTVSDNFANGTGGGIDNSGALAIVDSTIQGNAANGAFGDGGGIENYGPLSLIRSTVSNNTAGHIGGGIDKWYSPFLMVNSTVSGNYAALDGGGIYNFAHPITMTNSTVANNIAGNDGGGIFHENTVLSSTQSINAANAFTLSSKPGHTQSGSFDSLNAYPNPAWPTYILVQNSILASNTAPVGPDCYTMFEPGPNGEPNSLTSLGHNLIQATSGCVITGTATADIYGVDPGLGSLQDNGGPTYTLALQAGSPAVDAADDSACPPTDQRSQVRPIDGDQDGLAVCDIGAYEAVFAPKLYWTDPGTGKIQRASLNGTDIEDLLTGLDSPEGIALDSASGQMYWAEAGLPAIQRANLDGSGVQSLVTNLGNPMGIALDLTSGVSATQKMYWTDTLSGTLQRASLDGNAVEVLLGGLIDPTGVALEVSSALSATQRMYWSEAAPTTLRRANLDGSGAQDLVSGYGGNSGVALDLTSRISLTQKVYWTDPNSGTLRRANLDGAGVEDLLTGLVQPLGIALELNLGQMYWADSASGKIQRANLDGTGLEDLVTTSDGLISPHWVALDISNHAPFANAQSLTTPEDTPLNLTLSGSDPDQDAITIQVTGNPAHGSLSGTPPDLVYTPALDYNGGDSFTFQVRDVRGGTGTATIDILVTPVNDPPVALAGSDQNVDEGTPLDFTGSFTDPDVGDSHTIRWDFGDGTAATGALSITHAYTDNGVYTATLTITDAAGLVGSDELLVTVLNVAPDVNAGPDQTASEGDAVTFNGSYTDPGSLDTHTYEWDFGDGSTITGTLAPTYTYADNGVYTATLTVRDDDGGVGVDALSITVNNVAPTVDAGPEVVIAHGGTASFQGSFNDSGSLDTHTIQWDFGDGTTLSGTLVPTHTYTATGNFTVTLTVTDDDGGAGVDTTLVSYWEYHNNFEAPTVGQEWSQPTKTNSPSGEGFLGEFGNNNVNLSFSNLPKHIAVKMSFDVYILRSWDGNSIYITLPNTTIPAIHTPNDTILVGPDIWEARVEGGDILIRTTFSNWPDGRQAYPNLFPQGGYELGSDYPAFFGATQRGSLGYSYGNLNLSGNPVAYSGMDSVYHMAFTFPHTGDELSLNFAGINLQALEDESWGLDNIHITLWDGAEMPFVKLYLPLTPRQ